ncbi:MAG: hypothetical protein ACI9MC_001716 [Kiritimatiellia bacterium]|jgi:hypothetical protein
MPIEPFSPLDAHDPRYVTPPQPGGVRLADLLARSLSPIAVTGHAGLGKSTELRRSLADLPDNMPGILVNVAAPCNPEHVLYDIATSCVEYWVQHGPEQQPSPFLVEDLRASDPSFSQGRGRTLKPDAICLAALDELVGAYDLGPHDVQRIVLLVDGVDRLPADAARRVMLQLLKLRPFAAVAVVTSQGAVTGPNARQVLHHYRVMAISPVDVGDADVVSFLCACAASHLGDQDQVSEELQRIAAEHSGGVLRTMLSLVKDACSYADDQVDADALELAIADQVERVRRLICDGDRDVLKAADGRDGLEVPVERKARLLDQGLLFEYGMAEATICRISPLVRRLL